MIRKCPRDEQPSGGYDDNEGNAVRRTEPTPELLAGIREIRADRANWNRGRPPGFERLADEFFPDVDRLLVRRAAEVVMAEEKAASAPGTAVAVADGAAPELFEPEPTSGDALSPLDDGWLTPDDVGVNNGRSYVVASALARVLGHRDAATLVRPLVPDEVGTRPVRMNLADGRVQTRDMVIIYRRGVMRLLFRSDKPVAREITDKVLDILDEIERTGGYISPTATPTQLDQLSEELEARKAVALLSVLTAARELVGDDWTQARARSLVAGVVGGEAEIDMERRPLMVHTYLADKGLGRAERKKHGSNFGKVVKALYIAKHGKEPATRETDVDGHWIPACAYSERDRPLMDQGWRQFEQSFRGNETDY